MRDENTIRRFDLLKPSQKDCESALRRGFWMFVLAYIVVAVVMSGADTVPEWTLWGPMLFGAAWAGWRLLLLFNVLTPRQRARLERQLALIQRQKALKAAREAAVEEIESGREALLKLAELALRMTRLDAAGFAERLAELEQARRHRIELIMANERLIVGYDHEWQMLAIEIDALDATDIMPSDPSASMDAKRAELAALGEWANERRRLRAAEAEISGMLM